MKFHVPIPIATEIWTTRVPKKVQRPMGDTCAYEGQLTYEIRNTRLRMPRFQMRPPSPRGILICLFLWKKKKYIYIYMRACIFKEKGRRTGSPRVQKKVSRELFDFTFVAYICERGHIGSICCSLHYSTCISDRIYGLGHVHARVYMARREQKWVNNDDDEIQVIFDPIAREGLCTNTRRYIHAR